MTIDPGGAIVSDRKPKFKVGQVVRVWNPRGTDTYERINSYVGYAGLIKLESGTSQFENLCCKLTKREACR